MGLWSRRQVIGTALGMSALALAGCAPDPKARKHRGEKEAPGGRQLTPQVRNDLSAGAHKENQLADLATAVAGADAANRAKLNALAAAHRRHAAVLGADDPFDAQAATKASSTPAKASSSPTPDESPTLDSLRRTRRETAAWYRTHAVSADDPSLALLWASLSVFAGNSSTAPAARLDDIWLVQIDEEPVVDAQQVLLSHINAMLGGLEWGLGQTTDATLHEWGSQRREQLRTLRTSIHEQVRDASATPTPFNPAYSMPGRPANPAATRAMWAQLQENVISATGRVTAATQSQKRADAVKLMADELTHLGELGAATPTWPGWV